MGDDGARDANRSNADGGGRDNKRDERVASGGDRGWDQQDHAQAARRRRRAMPTPTAATAMPSLGGSRQNVLHLNYERIQVCVSAYKKTG